MDASESRFVELYESTYTELVRFAVRRGAGSLAEDIAAEALSITWRRWADVPESLDDPRAWIFGVARKLLLARQRRVAQGFTMQICDPADLPELDPGHEEDVASAIDFVAAWKRLSSVHQEALSLAVWDGLTSGQAAQVLDISPAAHRIRLSRARKALERLVDA